MAVKQLRLGASEDVLQYDDADFDCAVETDAPIKAGAPVDPTDVIRLSDVGAAVGDVVGPAGATDNAIVRFNLATGKIIQDSVVIMNDDGDITVPDDNWIGLGAAKGRILFEDDAPNVISFQDCEVEVGSHITLDDNGSIYSEAGTSKQPRLILENQNDDTHACQFNFWKKPDTLNDDDQLAFIGGYCERTVQPIVYMDFRIADETVDHTGGEVNFGCKIDEVSKYMLRLKGYNGAVGEGEVIFNDSNADIDFIIKGTGGSVFIYDAGADTTSIGDGGTTDYLQIGSNGDVSFAGTAGFYPRFLTQAAEPAAGVGATQCDTSEMVVWKDSDDNKVYLCFNDGGTVKTVELA